MNDKKIFVVLMDQIIKWKKELKMTKTKNKYSVAKVTKNGKLIGYLSNRDEEQGLDIVLDLQGYNIESL